MINVKEENRIRRDELEALMPLFDLKNLLQVSWGRVMRIVMNGEISVYNISGEYITSEDITPYTRGLRVLPSDVRDYVRSIQVN